MVIFLVTVAVSLKNRVYAYGKFYYESVVILYNTQNKSKFKLHFIYMLGFMGKYKSIKVIIGTLKNCGGLFNKLIKSNSYLLLKGGVRIEKLRK